MRSPTGGRDIELVASTLCVGAAATTFVGTFVPLRLVVPIVVGSTMPGAIAVWSGRRRPESPVWAVAAAQAGAFVVAWVALFVRTVPTVSGLPGAFWRALRDGGAEVLSTVTPVVADRNTLTVPFLLVWGAAALSSAAVLSSRAAPLVIAPAGVLAAAGVLVSWRGALPYRAWPVVMLVAAGAVFVATARRRALGRGWPGASLVAAAVALAVPIAGLGLFRTGGPAVLRERWQPASSSFAPEHPFAVLARARRADGSSGVVADVSIRGPVARPVVMRLATLDAFDGVRWRSTGRYAPLGEQLPPLSDRNDAPIGGTAVDAVITFHAGNRLPFVPQLGTYAALRSDASVPQLVMNPRDGSLAFRSGRPAQAGTMRADAVVPDGSVLTDGVPSLVDDSEPDAIVDVPGLADVAGGGPGDPRSTVDAITRLLGNENGESPRFAVDPTIEGPITVETIRVFLGLDGDRPEVGFGPPEEFAVAFALLAHERDVAVRLGYGFVLSPDEVRDGSVSLTEAMLSVWPEVHVAGAGWVRVDPVPDRHAVHDADVVATTTSTTTTTTTTTTIATAADPTPDVPQGEAGSAGAAGSSGAAQHDTGGRSVWLILLVVAVLLSTAGAGLPRFLKMRRRALRQRGSPAARVAGAWSELRDELGRRQIPRPRWLTTSDTVAAVRRSMGDEAAVEAANLAGVLDLSLFGQDDPTDADAIAAWALVSRVKAVARRPERRSARMRIVDPISRLGHRSSRGG
ncbi:MAG TPA: transglutaminase domain-containing protein [Microthrixaceae bacterium]|nr:transglutaminase domain-containing protein [Microthrixaceae bacterium]HQF95551.1 transglutaminase domain-containing protein [Microthrixaceae bacterium]